MLREHSEADGGGGAGGRGPSILDTWVVKSGHIQSEQEKGYFQVDGTAVMEHGWVGKVRMSDVGRA